MKKTLLTLAIALAGFATVNAQKGFYVSLAGGPMYKAGEKTLSEASGLQGSYGEGMQAQLRGGYFFNDKVGIDLGVGYLHGDGQQIINSGGINVEGSARAFGAALSGVYNISQNVYVRAGLLTKLGGKTELEGSINQSLPVALFTGQPTTATAPLVVDFTRDNHGQFPIGFIGAFGVKHKIAENWGIFAEMEYQGINVDADNSEIGDFSATFAGEPVSREALLGASQRLPLETQVLLNRLIGNEITFVDNPTTLNEAPSTQAPYSSFGFSFGVTYFF